MSDALFRERTYNKSIADKLISEGEDPTFAKIYAARDVKSLSDLKYPLSRMIPVKELTNTYKMANILADAIKNQDKIVVIADYDCDGATSCAVSMKALKGFGANVDYLVPNRVIDGYGLTPGIVKKCMHLNPKFLFTVDNGIASIEGVKFANENGIKVLVTDHHLPGATHPDAECIVNPSQHGCNFPSKNLAGVGVAWYTMAALQKVLNERGVKTTFNVKDILDLVALGTVADVVRLDYNNQCLVYNGLKLIREGKGIPLITALVNVDPKRAKEVNKITTMDFGFQIGPRINAAGRLEDMSVGINGLLETNQQIAEKTAIRLNDINDRRKEEERKVKNEVEEDVDKLLKERPDSYTMVFYGEDWHEGVIGIVASRVKDRTNRPTIIFAENQFDGSYKGSGRSIPGFHMRDCLDLISKRRPDIFSKFGGHSMAAGLSVNVGKFEDFKIEFEKAAREKLTEEELQEYLDHDGEIPDHAITVDFVEKIQDGIWGQGFPIPSFYGKFKVESQTVMKELHLKLKLNRNGHTYEGLIWNTTAPLPDSIECCFELSINDYNNTKKVQLMIKKPREKIPETKISQIKEIHKTEDGFCF